MLRSKYMKVNITRLYPYKQDAYKQENQEIYEKNRLLTSNNILVPLYLQGICTKISSGCLKL